MIIVLAILLGVSVLLLILFGRAILYQHRTILEIQRYINEISFLNGDDIDEELVLNRYQGALVISCALAQEDGSIWDVSLYEKKRIIGLTLLVTKQTVLDRIMANKEKFLGYKEEELVEMFVELLENLQNEVTISPMVEVLQMKDGNWIFRQVETNDDD